MGFDSLRPSSTEAAEVPVAERSRHCLAMADRWVRLPPGALERAVDRAARQPSDTRFQAGSTPAGPTAPACAGRGEGRFVQWEDACLTYRERGFDSLIDHWGDVNGVKGRNDGPDEDSDGTARQ